MKRNLPILGFLILLTAACGNPESSSQQESTNTTATTSGSTAGTSSAEMLPGEKLVAKADCMGCHNKTEKVIGPAYVEIASKYASNEKNIEELANTIISGGKGHWGDIAMTPHANLSKDDAKSMVTWILSLSK